MSAETTEVSTVFSRLLTKDKEIQELRDQLFVSREQILTLEIRLKSYDELKRLNATEYTKERRFSDEDLEETLRNAHHIIEHLRSLYQQSDKNVQEEKAKSTKRKKQCEKLQSRILTLELLMENYQKDSQQIILSLRGQLNQAQVKSINDKAVQHSIFIEDKACQSKSQVDESFLEIAVLKKQVEQLQTELQVRNELILKYKGDAMQASEREVVLVRQLAYLKIDHYRLAGIPPKPTFSSTSFSSSTGERDREKLNRSSSFVSCPEQHAPKAQVRVHHSRHGSHTQIGNVLSSLQDTIEWRGGEKRFRSKGGSPLENAAKRQQQLPESKAREDDQLYNETTLIDTRIIRKPTNPIRSEDLNSMMSTLTIENERIHPLGVEIVNGGGLVEYLSQTIERFTRKVKGESRVESYEASHLMSSLAKKVGQTKEALRVQIVANILDRIAVLFTALEERQKQQTQKEFPRKERAEIMYQGMAKQQLEPVLLWIARCVEDSNPEENGRLEYEDTQFKSSVEEEVENVCGENIGLKSFLVTFQSRVSSLKWTIEQLRREKSKLLLSNKHIRNMR